MDLGLKQSDLAAGWGLRTEAVARWERGLAAPLIAHWPAILDFLGYDPESISDTLPGRLWTIRRRLGLTRRRFAEKVGLDEGSLCHWERGNRQPSRWMARRVGEILRRIEADLSLGDGEVHLPMGVGLSFFDLTRWRRTPPIGIRPATLGERLRAKRLELGLSQEAVGRRFGVSRAAVHRWERGEVIPSSARRTRVTRFVSIKPARPS
ncbi:MAG: transcriptional regulator [Candidatus Eisenbacteria bacterium]|nr:transcriptional regulator [Candidatus Eisenbacteria bacterium]